jgi:hypothetical protein
VLSLIPERPNERLVYKCETAVPPAGNKRAEIAPCD